MYYVSVSVYMCFLCTLHTVVDSFTNVVCGVVPVATKDGGCTTACGDLMDYLYRHHQLNGGMGNRRNASVRLQTCALHKRGRHTQLMKYLFTDSIMLPATCLQSHNKSANVLDARTCRIGAEIVLPACCYGILMNFLFW